VVYGRASKKRVVPLMIGESSRNLGGRASSLSRETHEQRNAIVAYHNRSRRVGGGPLNEIGSARSRVLLAAVRLP
jgi:hypothetical protein